MHSPLLHQLTTYLYIYSISVSIPRIRNHGQLSAGPPLPANRTARISATTPPALAADAQYDNTDQSSSASSRRLSCWSPPRPPSCSVKPPLLLTPQSPLLRPRLGVRGQLSAGKREIRRGGLRAAISDAGCRLELWDLRELWVAYISDGCGRFRVLWLCVCLWFVCR